VVDAIADRLAFSAYRLTLEGDSMRRQNHPKTISPNAWMVFDLERAATLVLEIHPGKPYTHITINPVLHPTTCPKSLEWVSEIIGMRRISQKAALAPFPAILGLTSSVSGNNVPESHPQFGVIYHL
jgi:hypothetical protein